MTTIILEIDGVQVEHQIDAEGNATLDGEIKFTKGELDALNSQTPSVNTPAVNTPTEDDDVTFDMIAQASGLSILDTENKPKVYEMTTEGLANWGKDVHATGYKVGKDEAISSLFQSNPDLYDMYRYKQEKGTLDGYTSRPDFNALTIDDTTPQDELWEIIYYSETLAGKTKEQARKFADYAKANESLKADAIDALAYIKKTEDAQNEQRRLAAEEANRVAAETEERYYGVTYENGKEKVLNIEGSMYDLVVNKGTIGDLFIPATGIKVKSSDGKEKQLSRKDIFDYMSKPVKEINGILYTQAQIDEYSRMQTLQAATQQYLMNIAGTDVIGTLLRRATTSKAIKIVKSNQPGANSGRVDNSAGNGNNSSAKAVLPVS